MKRANNFLRYGIPGLALAGYAVAVLRSDSAGELHNVGTALVQIPGSTMLIVLVLSVLNYALRFWRWQSYLSRTGVAVPAVDHLLIYTTGLVRVVQTDHRAADALSSSEISVVRVVCPAIDADHTMVCVGCLWSKRRDTHPPIGASLA